MSDVARLHVAEHRCLRELYVTARRLQRFAWPRVADRQLCITGMHKRRLA